MAVTFGSKIIVEMPDGTKFHCATPEQAAAMYRLARDQKPVLQLQPSQIQAEVAESIKNLMERIAVSDGKQMGAAEMAAFLGVESPNGVGTKLRHLRGAAAIAGVNLDRHIVQRKGAGGGLFWELHAEPVGDLL